MSSSTSISEEASVCSARTRTQDHGTLNILSPAISCYNQSPLDSNKKKRNRPGNPDPDAEVVALSPASLLATNRFLCEVCGKGFQRDQNLQLHRRGHNLPWKLGQIRSAAGGGGGVDGAEKRKTKKVYVCPEESCVHHHPSRALGDLTGIKKHFCRKHGEKKWQCRRCSKKYAVMADWKAHAKTCGTREYRCNCGAVFSRKDSFVTHRAFCDALAEESAKLHAATAAAAAVADGVFTYPNHYHSPQAVHAKVEGPSPSSLRLQVTHFFDCAGSAVPAASPHFPATATMGHWPSVAAGTYGGGDGADLCAWLGGGGCLPTRDFLGAAGGEELRAFSGRGASSSDLGLPGTMPVAPAKPDPAMEFGFRYQPAKCCCCCCPAGTGEPAGLN